MKKLIVLLAIVLAPIFAMSQDWYYSKVINTDSISTSTLVDKAITWTLNNNISKYVAYNNNIYGKGSFDLDYLGIVTYTINIQCVDGKFRYILTDFMHKKESYGKTDIISAGRTTSIGYCGMINYSGGSLYNEKPQSSRLTLKEWSQIKEKVEKKTNQLIQGLVNKMITNGTNNM